MKIKSPKNRLTVFMIILSLKDILREIIFLFNKYIKYPSKIIAKISDNKITKTKYLNINGNTNQTDGNDIRFAAVSKMIRACF